MSTTYSGPVVSTNGFTGDLTGNVNSAPASGVTTVGPLVKLTETIPVASFTDATTTGTYTFQNDIPIGATFLYAAITAVVGFAGDTSAVITIGDGTDVDRYHTGTPDVFTTAAGGVDAGAPSGTLYHAAAKTPTVIITSASDFTLVVTDGNGSVTISLYYLAA